MAAPGTTAYDAKQSHRARKRGRTQEHIASALYGLGGLAQGLGSFARQRQEQQYADTLSDIYAAGQPTMQQGAPTTPFSPWTASPGRAAPQAAPMGYGNEEQAYAQMAELKPPSRMAGQHFQMMGQMQDRLAQKQQQYHQGMMSQELGKLRQQLMGTENPEMSFQQMVQAGQIRPEFYETLQRDVHYDTKNRQDQQDRMRVESETAMGDKALSALTNRMSSGRSGLGFMRQALSHLPESQGNRLEGMYDIFTKTREGMQQQQQSQALEAALQSGDPSGLDHDGQTKFYSLMAQKKSATSGGGAAMRPEVEGLLKQGGKAMNMTDLAGVLEQASSPEEYEYIQKRLEPRAAEIGRRESNARMFDTKRDNWVKKYQESYDPIKDPLTGKLYPMDEDAQEGIRSRAITQIKQYDKQRAKTLNPRLGKSPTALDLYAEARAFEEGMGSFDDVDALVTKLDGTALHKHIMASAESVLEQGDEAIAAAVRNALETWNP